MEQETGFCATQAEQLRENVGILAEALADAERARRQAGEIRGAAEEIVSFVRGYPGE